MKSLNLKKLSDAGFCVPRFEAFDNVEKVNTDFSDKPLFAVRSDFSAEDGIAQSFAGQFKTELNVPKSEVSSAALRVMQSCEDTFNSGYSKSVGKMNIIIQEMVQPRLSGVIFTANPSGLISEMVLVAGFGLGAGVVEDKVPTTTVYYSAADKLYYTETQSGAPEISDSLIKQLFETAIKVRKLFCCEQDIEFALCEETVYLLQARPITTLDFNAPALVLDNSNIVESYPGISLPATQSFVKEVYTKVFKSCVRRVAKNDKLCSRLEPSLQNMVDAVNGRIYYRISSWYDLICMLPFSKKITPVWQEMLGVGEKSVITTAHIKTGFFTRTKTAFNFFSALLSTPREMERLSVYFKKQLPVYWQRAEKCSDITQLLAFYDDLLTELCAKWDVTLINDLYAFIFTAIAKKKHPDKISTVYRLESMRPVKALQQLCKIYEKHGIKSPEYLRARALYIQDYGDRALEELKLETVTMRTNPQLLDEYAAAQANNISDFDVELTDTKHQHWAVKKARCGIQNRERSRLDRCRIYGVAREILLKIGQLLALEGLIENKEDVFWLELTEIRRLEHTKSCCKALINQRKALYEGYSHIPAYSRMVFLGKVFNKAPQSIAVQHSCDEASLLCGVPCSGGVAEGEVLLVTKASLTLDTKGKILVTQTTDPGWVFLIKNAAGLISEKGSLLSHTSIIARELKKPAVCAVQGVTSKLKNGERVRIDGTNGTITRLNSEGS